MSLSGSPEQWREAQANVATLTPRQLEVLTLIAEGLSQKGIARTLEISPRTTEVHRGQMMMKIGARTPGDAARIAVYAALAERLGDDEPGTRTPRVP